MTGCSAGEGKLLLTKISWSGLEEELRFESTLPDLQLSADPSLVIIWCCWRAALLTKMYSCAESKKPWRANIFCKMQYLHFSNLSIAYQFWGLLTKKNLSVLTFSLSAHALIFLCVNNTLIFFSKKNDKNGHVRTFFNWVKDLCHLRLWMVEATDLRL